MIHSMTGYAAASAELPRATLVLELRSVNARFLDLQFRLPDELRALEPALREQLAARLARGKVDCRVGLNDADSHDEERTLNARALDELARLEAAARRAFPDAAPLRVADVLRWPGVLGEAEIDEQATRAIAQRLCREVLDQFVAARAREGEKLAAAIRARIAEMRRRVAEVAPLVPAAIAAYQEKIATRLREAIGSNDDERVRAEIAVFGMKADVDEELTRLGAHMGEVERVLDAGGAAGKRLDFLMQELNREANTLASKAASQRIADCALELKLLIEQMREQVQNIE
jgi:uncharacterized protein (TIGR00255 family)